jgi:hypothetical protein
MKPERIGALLAGGALLALIAAIFWQDVLVSDGPMRATFNATSSLKGLVASLELYRSVHQGYPDAWLEDMYPKNEQSFGPPAFAVDLQSAPQVFYAYHEYRYTPPPLGCVEPNCHSYTLAALPTPALRQYKKYRYRGRVPVESYFVDQTGVIRHCKGHAGADATDPPIDQPLTKC